MTTAELLDRLEGVTRLQTGKGWVARCPAHEDEHASLSVADAGDDVLLKCHAGCTFDAILAAVPKPPRPEPVIEATYPYRAADGRHLYDVVRFRPKAFRQRRSDGTWSLNGVERVPYRLPELLASTRGVVVVEGEKDADRLAALGIEATCNPGGAGKWRPEYAAHLLARTVVILPDNDDAGRNHAADVARSLAGEDVRLLELPGLPPKGDVSDWLDAGHGADELRELLRTAPAYSPSLLSAERPEPPGSTQILTFRTAREIVAELPATIAWLHFGYIAFGVLVELVGGAKSAGKTTFLAHLIRAVLDGLEFLGRPTAKTPVVLLTEQPSASLREVLARAGLTDRDDLVILPWRDARVASWETIVAAAVAECRRRSAKLLVVDTLPAFARMRGDAENDAGTALAAIEPLQAAAADGLAVLVVRHERKSGGEVGTSGRGSSAFTGAVDVVLRLARQENPVRPTIRVLSALSRFDETPAELVIELTDAGYIALGDQAAVAFAEARTGVLDVLPDEGGLTVPELLEAIGGRRTTIQSAIASLIDDGEVIRDGTGRKGDPFRYRRTPPLLSAERSPPTGGGPRGTDRSVREANGACRAGRDFDCRRDGSDLRGRDAVTRLRACLGG